MKILLVNAFHYLRGGVERTVLDEERWLAAAGHEVAPFAIRDPRNVPSRFEVHFAPAADYGEGAPVARQIAQLSRALWSAPAAAALRGLLAEFRPDVAHVHAPSRYLTPSVLRVLDRAGIPIVMTLHDFKPWCTNRLLFAHGAPCERCRGGAHWHAAATGCVQDSRAKSAIGTVEAYLHEALGAYDAVRIWIAPSAFVVEKAVEHGVPRARLRLLPHGLDPPPLASDAMDPGRFVLFAGRLSVEKGTALLPEIARGLGGTRLSVIGDGPLRPELEAAAREIPNLRVMGYLDDEGLAHWRAYAAAVIVPSLFYEHFCYTAAEALQDARPVVASRIGAIPEIVEHEVTGLLVPPGDAAACVAAVTRALGDPAAPRWGEAGRARVAELTRPEKHLSALLAIYREAMG